MLVETGQRWLQLTPDTGQGNEGILRGCGWSDFVDGSNEHKTDPTDDIAA